MEEQLNSRDDIFDDEMKDIIGREVRLIFVARLFKEREDWKRNLMELKQFNVIKMGRVLQSLLYLLGYERERICEKNSNKFFWKYAKQYIDENFVNRLIGYKVMGPKDGKYPGYMTLNFIERNLEGILPEDVDQYNLTLGKLFKWL